MKLYIGGISKDVTESELKDLYSQFSNLVKVDLLKDPETGENRGYAFVEFGDDQSGESALLGTHNTLLGGMNIQVSISRSRLDQKRARQNNKHDNHGKKHFHNNDHGRHNGQARNNNQSRNSDRDQDSQESDHYNSKNYNTRQEPRHNNYGGYKKGVDYGRRNTQVGGPQTSFLGQEGFGASPRTSDPMYTNNNYNTRNNNQGNYNNRNRNQNSYGSRNNRRPSYSNNSNNVPEKHNFKPTTDFLSEE